MKYYFIIGIVLFLGVISCEIHSISLEESSSRWAIPLFHSEFTSEELLKAALDSTKVGTTEDGLLAVILDLGKVDVQMSDLIKPVIFPFPIPLFDTCSDLPLISAGGFSVSQATIAGDNLQFILSTEVEMPLTTHITISFIQLEDKPLEHTVHWNESTANTPHFTEKIPLDGYSFTGGSDDLEICLRTVDSSGRVQKITAAVLIDQLSFSYIQGQVGRQSFEDRIESVNFPSFDNITLSEVNVPDVQLLLKVKNGFGLPIHLNDLTIEAVNRDGERSVVESEILANGVRIPYPGLDEVGTFQTVEIELTKANSNIDEILSLQPQEFLINYDLIINPDEKEDEFFISDSAGLVMEFDVDIPLKGSVGELHLESSSLMDISEAEGIKSSELTLLIKNELPVGMIPDLHFTDSVGNILLELPGEQIVAGRIGQAVESELIYQLSEAQNQLLAASEKIFLTLDILIKEKEGILPEIRPGQKVSVAAKILLGT